MCGLPQTSLTHLQLAESLLRCRKMVLELLNPIAKKLQRDEQAVTACEPIANLPEYPYAAEPVFLGAQDLGSATSASW